MLSVNRRESESQTTDEKALEGPATITSATGQAKVCHRIQEVLAQKGNRLIFALQTGKNEPVTGATSSRSHPAARRLPCGIGPSSRCWRCAHPSTGRLCRTTAELLPCCPSDGVLWPGRTGCSIRRHRCGTRGISAGRQPHG